MSGYVGVLKMIDEKRKFIRFPFKMKAELSILDKMYEVNEIINLSIGGCLLPVNEVFEPGTPCRLKISLGITEEEPVLRVEGVVARHDQGNVAIKFNKIDPDSLNHLQKIAIYNADDPDRVEQEIRNHPGIL